MNKLTKNIEYVDNTTVYIDDYGITVPTDRLAAFQAGTITFAEAFDSVPPYLSDADYVLLRNAFGLADTLAIDDRLLEELEAQDQAIEAFMIERGEMQDMEAHLHLIARLLSEEVSDMNDVITGANDVIDNLQSRMVHAAQYVGKAKELLAGIGVYIDNDFNGDPQLTVELDQLLNAFGPPA